MSLTAILVLFLSTLAYDFGTEATLECEYNAIADFSIGPRLKITDSRNLTQIQKIAPGVHQLIIPNFVGKNSSDNNHSNLSIVFSCSSRWPIQWKFKGVKVNTFVANYSDYVTYTLDYTAPICYHTSLTFNRVAEGMTGEYECTHLGQNKSLNVLEPSLRSVIDQLTGGSSTLIVYAGHGIDGVNSQYLIQRSKSINVTGELVPQSRNGTVIFVQPTFFPCAVNHPEISDNVPLYQKIILPNLENIWTKVERSSIEEYKPWLGFTIVTELPTKTQIEHHSVNNPTVEDYKCETGIANDVVHFKMTLQQDYVSTGLTLNHTTRVATCTSEAMNDVVFSWTPCDTTTECEFKTLLFCVNCFENPAREEDDDCPPLPPIVSSNTYSVTVQLPSLSGEIRCKSATTGLYETRSFYISAMDDESVDEDMTSVDVAKLYYNCNFKSSAIVAGDIIDCECRTSSRIFTNDILWIFVWKNGSDRIVPDEFISSDSSTYKSNGLNYRSSSIQIPSVEVTQAKCVAFTTPVLVGPSSKIMYGKQYDLTVKVHRIVIQGLHYETIHFNESSTNIVLECIVESYPTAYIVWDVPPKPRDLITTYEVKLSTISTSAKLSLAKFDKSLQGEYSCEAFYEDSSFPKQRRTFRLIDEGSSKDNTILFGIIAAVLFLLVCLVAAVTSCLLIQARRKKSDIISHSKHVEEFLTGVSELGLTNMDEIEGYAEARLLPYDHSKFEISFEDLEFDMKDVLGSGAYGIVIKGRLKGNTNHNSATTSVAIKMIKPTAEQEIFNALLSELKVMMYIGNHPNLVVLLGACTEKLSERELYIILEFYSNGSLHEYLKIQRKVFINQVDKGKLVFGDEVNSSEGTSTRTLIHWAQGIASGMAYLSSKKVIHGDLATRNILLDENLIPKISDFGLSVKLYQTEYMKMQQASLPWRWMAIESLHDLKFSIQSDVWSYGILLWELFTLAELPYPGACWGQEFTQMIVDGYRMSRPKYAPFIIYEIMLATWQNDPGNRPSFEDLIERLNEFLDSVQSSSMQVVESCADSSNGRNLSGMKGSYVDAYTIDGYHYYE